MAMSRAVILPFPGDPYLIRYWLHFFRDVWYNEVDKVYILHNSTIEPEMEEYIKNECKDEKITYIYLNHQIEHGHAINMALDEVKEDYVCLIEDDAFVFKSGIINACFSQLENGGYDIIGSKRGSCAFEILEQAKLKWGIDYKGEGDQGCNFWPCYFFTKTSILLQTTRRFGARAWHKGETITPLQYVVDAPVVYGDTFVNTSLELRAMIPEHRIAYVPQYHASPDDFQNKEEGKYLFNGLSSWTHVGSLSTGVGGVLQDRENRPLIKRKLIEPQSDEPINHIVTDGEKREWARRLSFWQMFWEYSKDNRGNEEFYNLYGEAIIKVAAKNNIAINDINRFKKIYRLLGL